jgi:hypothetical protein
MTTPIATATDTTTRLARTETAMTAATADAFTTATANDAATVLAAPTTRKDTTMHSNLPINMNDDAAPSEGAAPPASTERVSVRRAPRPFQPRFLRKPIEPEDRLAYAEEELDWLHSARAEEARHVGRRAVLLGWLARLSPPDRGIIALRYDRRALSPILDRKLFPSTAIVVRAECAEHPMIGTVEAAERASVARLEALFRDGEMDEIADYESSAAERFDEAVEAFAQARDNVALVIPTPRVRRRTPLPGAFPAPTTETQR